MFHQVLLPLFIGDWVVNMGAHIQMETLGLNPWVPRMGRPLPTDQH